MRHEHVTCDFCGLKLGELPPELVNQHKNPVRLAINEGVSSMVFDTCQVCLDKFIELLQPGALGVATALLALPRRVSTA
jgi:hypothetical protein